ncbi:unnamed protein product [Paramecium sonneborni]|uniref:Uncharacterized protein n=1 Tax=Paramecium sonneborni TaxID=65129 RepID=A0A8S1MBC2_9CILI|nr:unnamed protein product [Paramecium sonneborni]
MKNRAFIISSQDSFFYILTLHIMNNPKFIFKLKNHKSWVNFIILHPLQEDLIIRGSNDTTLKFWASHLHHYLLIGFNNKQYSINIVDQIQSELLPTTEEFQNLLIQKSNKFIENNISSLTTFSSNFQGFLQKSEQFLGYIETIREYTNSSLSKVEQLNKTLLNQITSSNSPFQSSDILNFQTSIIQGDYLLEFNQLQNQYIFQLIMLKANQIRYYSHFTRTQKVILKKIFHNQLRLTQFCRLKKKIINKKKQILTIQNKRNKDINERRVAQHSYLNFLIKQFRINLCNRWRGSIIIEALEQLTVEYNDTNSNSHQIYHLDLIKCLKWIGKYETRNQKIGRWSAFWRGRKLENVGGIYNKEGKKTRLWVEIFSNFWQEAQVFEKGEYKNQNKQGQRSIIYKGQLMYDIQAIILLEAVVNIMNLERNKVIRLSYMNPFAGHPKFFIEEHIQMAGELENGQLQIKIKQQVEVILKELDKKFDMD